MDIVKHLKKTWLYVTVLVPIFIYKEGFNPATCISYIFSLLNGWRFLCISS